ncbi:MAG: efflux RND transporter periplasmic adaptor subunit [Phycisphaerales bacterium]
MKRSRRACTSMLVAAILGVGTSPGLGLVGEPLAAGEWPVQPPDAPGWEAVAAQFGGTPAATRACKDVQMSFSFSTEVAEVAVKGGDRVKRGDLLLRARDSEVRTAITQQKALAENDLEIQGATKDLELATITFENLKASKGWSRQEFEQRRIESETAAVRKELALFNREQQRMRLAQLEAQYERYRLLAPFDGVIEEVTVEVGQGVTEQDKVLRIVNIDKMWLDPTPKTAETLLLSIAPGSKAWVLIDLPGKPTLVEGRVIEVSPVADPVSLTRRVRVEIDNPRGWPPGTQALVRFSSPPTGGAAGWSAAASPGQLATTPQP